MKAIFKNNFSKALTVAMSAVFVALFAFSTNVYANETQPNAETYEIMRLVAEINETFGLSLVVEPLGSAEMQRTPSTEISVEELREFLLVYAQEQLALRLMEFDGQLDESYELIMPHDLRAETIRGIGGRDVLNGSVTLAAWVEVLIRRQPPSRPTFTQPPSRAQQTSMSSTLTSFRHGSIIIVGNRMVDSSNAILETTFETPISFTHSGFAFADPEFRIVHRIYLE